MVSQRRCLQVSGADGSYVKTSYDKLDKSTELHYKFNGQRRDVYFHYSDKDNLPLNVKFGPSSKYIVENTYDDLTRLKTRTYAIPGTSSKLSASYGYIDWTSTADRTTGTVRGIDYTYVSGGLSTYDRWYEYDGVGNITSENVWTSDTTKPLRESYSYDYKNQLVRHDSVTQNCTITYAYDAGGNITAKNIYAYTTGSLDGKTPTETINYTYGNSAWKDELTSYKGEAIEYDKIGNPTLYRGWGMTWQGRQLVKAEKDKTLTFTYDSEGIRTSKTAGSTTTKYLLNGTQILAQTTNGKTLSFFYDQQGNRVAMADSSNKFYYYIYNLQGDVIALADATTGKLVVTYTYDAWGKLVELKDTTANSIGTLNPFRYKGYYYDTETSLYYLQSRYYDPDTGRFISADRFASTDISGVLSTNMFAYCENRPTIGSDPTGEWIHIAVGAVVGGIVGGLMNAKFGGSIISGVLTGAAGGALAISGAGLAAQIAGSAALSAIDNTVTQLTSAPASSFSFSKLATETAIGAATGLIGGAGASSTNAKSVMGYGKQAIRQIKDNVKHGRSVIKPIRNYLKRAHVKGHQSVFKEFGHGFGESQGAKLLWLIGNKHYKKYWRR